MDSDHEELYLQKLKSYVLDEDKVVTSPWLSKTLDLDLKLSKDLLQTFLKDSKGSKGTDLVVTYALKGILFDDDLKGICIVKQDELEEKKKLFKVVDETVYSVQKGKSIDLNLIGMVDMLNVDNPPEKPMVGSVIGKNCITRKLKEKKVLPVVNRTAVTDKSKASHLFSNAKTKVENKNNTTINTKSNENAKTNETKTSKQHNDNKTSKPQNDNKTSKPQNDNKTNKPQNKNQKGSIATMFSNMPAKKAESPKRKSESAETKTKSPSKQVKVENSMEVDDDEDTDVEEQPTNGVKKEKFYDSGTDEEAKKIEEKNKNLNSGNNKRKSVKRTRKNDKSSERPQKKRKRIINRNDSDSDDMFADEDDDKQEKPDAVIESDDETVYKKVTPIEPKKGKKRTLVDKTFMDEEGYMVTKKEWIYETASEEENEENKANNKPEVKSKKPVEVEKPKEVSPTKGMKGKNKGKPAPTNQPTLMSFFKKK